MNIPEEVIDSIFDEVKKEILEDKVLSSDKPQTFHNIEGSILEMRKRFSERLAEVALEYESRKDQKKTVHPAAEKPKAKEKEKENC